MFEFFSNIFSTISSTFSGAFASAAGAITSTSTPAIAAIAGWTGISAVAATAVLPVIAAAGAVVAYKIIRNSWNAYKAIKGGPNCNLDINKVKTDSKNPDNVLTNSGGEIAIKLEGENTFFFQEKGVFFKKYELIGFKNKEGDLYQVTGEKKQGFFSNLWNSAKELASKVCNVIPFIPNTSHLPHYKMADIGKNNFSEKLEGFTCNKISGAGEFSQYTKKPSFWERTKRALVNFIPSRNLNNEYALKTIVNNLCLHNENQIYKNQNYENSQKKSELFDGKIREIQKNQEVEQKTNEAKQNPIISINTSTNEVEQIIQINTPNEVKPTITNANAQTLQDANVKGSELGV